MVKTKKHPMGRRAAGRNGTAHSARADILAAAERVFAQHGLAGARTDAIATTAGVNHALLFYYFGDKEHLYEAVLEEQFAGFNEQALEVLGGPGAPREILLRYVSLHFDFISSRRRHAPLFQQGISAGGAMTERLVRKYFAPRGRAFAKVLERGMELGEFRRGDPFHITLSIVALIVFYFTAAPVIELLGPKGAYEEANLKRRKQEVLDFIRHALFTNPSSKP